MKTVCSLRRKGCAHFGPDVTDLTQSWPRTRQAGMFSRLSKLRLSNIIWQRYGHGLTDRDANTSSTSAREAKKTHGSPPIDPQGYFP